jgi:hypothetical protein
MKNILLIIMLICTYSLHSQTITINNTSGSDFHVLDFIDMDCAGNDNGCTGAGLCGTSVSGAPALVLTGSLGFGHFPKINLQEVISSAVVSLYSNDPAVCFSSANPQTAFLGGITLIWTDLGAGFVRIDIF